MRDLWRSPGLPSLSRHPRPDRGDRGKRMQSETITERDDLFSRRYILEPGEALPWHTDLCHRSTVVVTGEKL